MNEPMIQRTLAASSKRPKSENRNGKSVENFGNPLIRTHFSQAC